jgi:peptidoglycan-N-acetylglucosamine deacetylase
MPHFSEQIDTLERWRRFPGRESANGATGAVLTFDDGPDDDATPAVLDALDQIGQRATFFLVGEQVERHPDLAREVASRGHEIALHGYAHEAHHRLTKDEARADLERGADVLGSALGETGRFYRPPYGRFSEGSYEACRAMGLEPVYWSAWGADWETISPERITELVVPDLAPGAIVLLHDSPRYAHRPSAVPTVEALPLIAAEAQSLGVPFVTLGEATAA